MLIFSVGIKIVFYLSFSIFFINWPGFITESRSIDLMHFPKTFAPVNEQSGLVFSYIKGGVLNFGTCEADSIIDAPIQVQVSDFYMSITEITNAEFAEFLNAYGSDVILTGENKGSALVHDSREFGKGRYNWGIIKTANGWLPAEGKENHPVIFVTWFGANEYCIYMSQKTNEKWRLPTEAEWEYAAKAGHNSTWPGTSKEADIKAFMWCNANSDIKTQPVAILQPNDFGLFDMGGNAKEWCADWFGPYPKTGTRNPSGPTFAMNKVNRGGSWCDQKVRCTTTFRTNNFPNFYDFTIGFRVCKSI